MEKIKSKEKELIKKKYIENYEKEKYIYVLILLLEFYIQKLILKNEEKEKYYDNLCKCHFTSLKDKYKKRVLVIKKNFDESKNPIDLLQTLTNTIKHEDKSSKKKEILEEEFSLLF